MSLISAVTLAGMRIKSPRPPHPDCFYTVHAPCYAEAELVLECRKIYWSDLDPKHFLDASIENNYPRKDYHRLYLGEIVALRAAERFIQNK